MIFRVNELHERFNEIYNDGHTFVELSFCEAEDEMPGCLWVSALENNKTQFQVDYDEIEEVIID